MTIRILVAAGWIAVASASVFVATPASPAEGALTCEDDVRRSTPIVADRLDRAIERCARESSPAPDALAPSLAPRAGLLIDCVAEARRDGFRTADSLDRAIDTCVG